MMIRTNYSSNHENGQEQGNCWAVAWGMSVVITVVGWGVLLDNSSLRTLFKSPKTESVQYFHYPKLSDL